MSAPHRPAGPRVVVLMRGTCRCCWEVVAKAPPSTLRAVLELLGGTTYDPRVATDWAGFWSAVLALNAVLTELERTPRHPS